MVRVFANGPEDLGSIFKHCLAIWLRKSAIFSAFLKQQKTNCQKSIYILVVKILIHL